jgi:hypothetical protein
VKAKRCTAQDVSSYTLYQYLVVYRMRRPLDILAVLHGTGDVKAYPQGALMIGCEGAALFLLGGYGGQSSPRRRAEDGMLSGRDFVEF